jgi:hypothetical protein
MKLKNQNLSKSPRKVSISVVLYVIASIIALIGISLLIDNIYMFRNTVTDYVNQGYPYNDIIQHFMPQLLPQIFEPIAIYGGIACVLLSIGKVNRKVSKCLELLNKYTVCEDAIEENTLEQNIDNV